MDEGHAKVTMDEVEKYINDTWFTWIGGSQDNSVYYYRKFSPVVSIDFDHQKPIATKKIYGTDVHRQHIIMLLYVHQTAMIMAKTYSSSITKNTHTTNKINLMCEIEY